jgi:hypothetical protein
VSIPIRIHNEHTKDIRVVMHGTLGPLVSYRIPACSTGPSMDMSAVHGIMITDEEKDVAVDPCKPVDAEFNENEPNASTFPDGNHEDSE